MSLKLTKKIRGQMKAIKLFDNHQQEARKKGGSNPLNAVEKNSVSDYELKKYLPDAKIIMYPELKKFGRIEEILPVNKSYAVILYLETENTGHWVSIKRNGDNLEFFCSYGSEIDEPLTWYDKETNEYLGQGVPYLTILVNKSNFDVFYNDIRYQSNNDDIVTCGRHLIFNIQKFLNYGDDLFEYYDLMKHLKKEEKLDYDEIVSKYINLILD